MKPEQEAKIRAIIKRDGLDVVIDRVKALFESAEVQQALDAKTDAQVADLLTHAMAYEDPTSMLGVLLSNAAERLRRAKGGPTGDDGLRGKKERNE